MLIKGNTKNKDLGYVFISEKSNMDCRDIKNVDTHNKHGVFYVSFDANLHSFGVMNRNNRMYMADNVWKCIQESEKIQALLADNAWFGEMNHPTQYYENQKLTPERMQDAAMENRSHKIMRPRLNGNLLQAHIETASGTDVGVGMAKEIIQGLRPAFSCRAVAVLQMLNGKPTVVVRRLITYDWVLYPSHKEAHLITDPKLIEKCADVYKESGNVEEETPDFIVPIKELLDELGERDGNVGTIMENFQFNLEQLVGLDAYHKHAIIKDRDNMIYVNINPESKTKVDDFFTSFS